MSVEVDTWDQWAAQADPEAVGTILDEVARQRWVPPDGPPIKSVDYLTRCTMCWNLCDAWSGSDANWWRSWREGAVVVCVRPQCEADADQQGLWH